MPRTTRKKKPAPAGQSNVQDADRVIRRYEESSDAPGGDVRERYEPTADRTASANTPLRRTIDEVGRDTVAVHGGDVDAGLDRDSAGEESIGGSNPTPDQDIVDEIGAGAGLTYQEDEPIDPDKVARRDEHRWELDPASAEDYEERTREGQK
jgi:Family of unknown function (DUF6335)